MAHDSNPKVTVTLEQAVELFKMVCHHKPKRCAGLCNRCYTMAWRRANPGRNREINRVSKHKYKARQRAGGSYTAVEWQTLKRQLGFRCVGCWKTGVELKALGRKLVPDHIIPISKGGLNIIENLQPLCHGKGGCNNKKHDKYQDFLIS